MSSLEAACTCYPGGSADSVSCAAGVSWVRNISLPHPSRSHVPAHSISLENECSCKPTVAGSSCTMCADGFLPGNFYAQATEVLVCCARVWCRGGGFSMRLA
jgi:hypothetical protein